MYTNADADFVLSPRNDPFDESIPDTGKNAASKVSKKASRDLADRSTTPGTAAAGAIHGRFFQRLRDIRYRE